MRLNKKIKLEVESFVYGFFKGIHFKNWDDFELFFHQKEMVTNLFNRFAMDQNDLLIASHIMEVQSKSFKNVTFVEGGFWDLFSKISEQFIYNRFAEPLKDDNYYTNLIGIGTGAVPIFSTLTNVVNVDRDMNVKNWSDALKRVNERALQYFDKIEPSIPFSKEELDQFVW